jgi:hypothetical protein
MFLRLLTLPLDADISNYISKVIQQIALEHTDRKTAEITPGQTVRTHETAWVLFPPKNAELKKRMRDEAIYYSDFEEMLHCNKSTVARWISTPLTEKRRNAVENTITQILKERQNL